MSFRNKIYAIIVIFTLLIIYACLNNSKRSFMYGNKKYLGIVEINGVLMDATDYVEQLEKMRKNKHVVGVLVRIDSPGGGVVVAQEIYEAMKRLRNEKPVVVSMGSVAASGGYYIACGSDIIYANPGTVTGSIGVIMEYPQIEELMKKIGIQQVVVKTGKFKDSGGFYKDLSKEEEKYFQSLVDKLFNDFKFVVIKERKLENPPSWIFDGRVFTGREAQKLGLIDSIGDKYAAEQYLKKVCDMEGDINWYKIKKKRNVFSILADYTSSRTFSPFVYYLLKI